MSRWDVPPAPGGAPSPFQNPHRIPPPGRYGPIPTQALPPFQHDQNFAHQNNGPFFFSQPPPPLPPPSRSMPRLPAGMHGHRYAPGYTSSGTRGPILAPSPPPPPPLPLLPYPPPCQNNTSLLPTSSSTTSKAGPSPLSSSSPLASTISLPRLNFATEASSTTSTQEDIQKGKRKPDTTATCPDAADASAPKKKKKKKPEGGPSVPLLVAGAPLTQERTWEKLALIGASKTRDKRKAQLQSRLQRYKLEKPESQLLGVSATVPQAPQRQTASTSAVCPVSAQSVVLPDRVVSGSAKAKRPVVASALSSKCAVNDPFRPDDVAQSSTSASSFAFTGPDKPASQTSALPVRKENLPRAVKPEPLDPDELPTTTSDVGTLGNRQQQLFDEYDQCVVRLGEIRKQWEADRREKELRVASLRQELEFAESTLAQTNARYESMQREVEAESARLKKQILSAREPML